MRLQVREDRCETSQTGRVAPPEFLHEEFEHSLLIGEGLVKEVDDLHDDAGLSTPGRPIPPGAACSDPLDVPFCEQPTKHRRNRRVRPRMADRLQDLAHRPVPSTPQELEDPPFKRWGPSHDYSWTGFRPPANWNPAPSTVV